MIYLLLGNLGRRLSEWADRRVGNERHVIDLMRDAWQLPEAARAWWRA